MNRPQASLVLIAAVADDGCIGRAGSLPWRLPSDLRRFRRLTYGGSVLMGRATWDSLPRRPLEGRRNLVLSRGSVCPDGATLVDDLEKAIRAATEAGDRELFVIGGAQVYALALPRAERIELTRVHARYPDGDAFFPDLGNEWKATSESREEGDPSVIYATLSRVA
jgi:dihydrofolate reductase